MNESEAILHCNKIQRLWPKSAEYTMDEVREFIKSFGEYSSQVIDDAISKVKRESQSQGRPGFGKFTNACKELSRDNRRGKEDQCQWCHNRRFVKIWCYVLSGIDQDQFELPENMRKRRPSGDYLVDPRIGKELDFSLDQIKEVNLKCHHCDLKIFRHFPSVKYFKETYGKTFAEFRWKQDEEYFDRLLNDYPLPEPERHVSTAVKKIVEAIQNEPA
jgi:hypothetical protein